MDQSKVLNMLKAETIQIEFTKANGEMRQMKATLNESVLPEVVAIEEKATRVKSEAALAVWDTEAKGWRSFRWDSLKTVNGETFSYA